MSSPSPQPDQSSADRRPVLAIVTGHLTPYREHFHRRIAAELPELRLATLVTKHRTGPWVNRANAEIGTAMLDPTPPPREPVSMAVDRGGRSRVGHVAHELGTARRTWKWLDEHPVAAVVCSGYDELPNLWALRWANRRRVPVLMWSDANVHGDLASGVRRLVKNIYVRRVTARFSGLLVCGGVGKRFFNRYGVSDERLFVMPYEPDYAMIRDLSGAQVEAAAAKLGLAPGRLRMVCCCRLIPVKRVDLVIGAFAGIASERPEWDLVIVGMGEERERLEAAVPEPLRADGRVRFLGFQDQATVAAVYRASHAMVLASDYEPWALVINEACAAGLAIVASDRVGAAYELVRDGVNGRVVPAGNAAALTDAMRGVTDGANLEAMRAASTERLAEWRRTADPIAGLRAALAACGVAAIGRP